MGKVAGRTKGGPLAGRLGIKGGGGGVADARQKIIQANRGQIGDAREKLGKIAKTTDARSKLERIRGLKDGNLEVKQVGGITVTKKLDGKLMLSTKSKSDGGAGKVSGQITQIGRLTKTVSSSGQVALTSKSARSESAAESRGAGGMRSEARSEGRPASRGSASSVLRGAAGREQKENKRRGGLFDMDSLDDELMATRVDPMLLKKTVERSRTIGDARRSVILA